MALREHDDQRREQLLHRAFEYASQNPSVYIHVQLTIAIELAERSIMEPVFQPDQALYWYSVAQQLLNDESADFNKNDFLALQQKMREKELL